MAHLGQALSKGPGLLILGQTEISQLIHSSQGRQHGHQQEPFAGRKSHQGGGEAISFQKICLYTGETLTLLKDMGKPVDGCLRCGPHGHDWACKELAGSLHICQRRV